ncbi:MAG: class I SAM-dependent methyltransferase [Polyangiaceae bacterium]
MARETAAANRTARELLTIEPGDAVLEVGFGHGQTAYEIVCDVPTATVAGVDPSEVMVRVARRKTRGHRDRVDLQQGAVEDLPFDDNTFDKALGVHTTYFWPSLDAGLREVRRTLRPGGRFVLGFRPADDDFAAATLPVSVYSLHTVEEMRTALVEAGFANVTTHRMDLTRGFIVWAVCS